jgi:capsular exopolysaccharide synthesis family protein
MAKTLRTKKTGKMGELIVKEDPKSPISEKLRTLRTNILFSSVDEEIKTILITSPTPGDGKSWISANLAIAFAQTGSKVLLIDGDLRKGRQHKIFDLSNEFGFSNYLLKYGKKRIINDFESIVESELKIETSLADTFKETSVPNLTVMTSGSVPPNPSELLGSKKMLKLFESIKKKYDIIIIDGPPVNVVTDSLILTRFVDTTVLVASVKKTQVKHLISAKKTIENVGGKLAGIVVNKIPVTSGKQYTEYYEYYQRKEDAIKNK